MITVVVQETRHVVEATPGMVVVVQTPSVSVVEVSAGGSGGGALYGEGLPGGQNAYQRLTVSGTPTGGDFTLDFDGQITSAIAFDATAPDTQSALEALSNIGAGNVEVVSNGDLPSEPMYITFVVDLGHQPITLLAVDSDNLTGDPAADITLVTLVAGTEPVVGQATDMQLDTTEDTGSLWFDLGGERTTLKALSAFDANGVLRALVAVGEGVMHLDAFDELGILTARLEAGTEFLAQTLLNGEARAEFELTNDDGLQVTKLAADGSTAGRILTVEGGIAVESDLNGNAVASVLTGTVDPTAGAGVAALSPALYLRDNGGVTEPWIKTGAADVDWTMM